MPKLLLATALIFVSLFGGKTSAQEVPWSGTCARLYVLTSKRELVTQTSQYGWMGSWGEVEQGLAILAGKPSVKVSFEFVQTRYGHLVISAAEYASDCNSFPADDAEILALKEKSRTKTLKQDDFTGPRWLHLVKAIDSQEDQCVSYNRLAGKWSGCGDLWQGGMTEDKVVCFNNRSYPRCQVECIKQIYRRELELQDGFCAEERP
jgi:hypothetical protein